MVNMPFGPIMMWRLDKAFSGDIESQNSPLRSSLCKAIFDCQRTPSQRHSELKIIILVMPPVMSKKRKTEGGVNGHITRPAKKSRKQAVYSSGSSEESDTFGVEGPDGPQSAPPPNPNVMQPKHLLSKETQKAPRLGSEADDTSEEDRTASGSELDAASTISASDASNLSSSAGRKVKSKRNDPAAFSASLNAILSSKLSHSKRDDPVLARSKDARLASHELSESRLEQRARRKLREERRLASERDRVKDVLLGDRRPLNGAGLIAERDDATDMQGKSAAQIREQEQRLRKVAQRGVVKLFNAIKAAQVRGEEAAREARNKGVVGIKKREEQVGEMSRNAFLDLVAAGGVKKP
jgi:hypothetical protein